MTLSETRVIRFRVPKKSGITQRDFRKDNGHSVKRIPPDTGIHEQMTMTNGYGKVCTTSSTLPTSVRPLLTTM